MPHKRLANSVFLVTENRVAQFDNYPNEKPGMEDDDAIVLTSDIDVSGLYETSRKNASNSSKEYVPESFK